MLDLAASGARPERRRKTRGPGRLLPCRLGPYELFDHVGRGGMADIYRARHVGALGTVREVVVKEILPELAESERLTDLLVQEAKLAAQLDHPNVVRVEHLGQEDGGLYIAMEWVEGLDLRELLRRCARQGVALPVDVSVFVVVELLRGLEHAHDATLVGEGGGELRGLVHRDVSPSNVLLSFDGEVKICDFGIARAHDECADDGALVEGKAGYMSPEQARGEALDRRADVFAAGIVLWELLAGRRFYKAKSGGSLLDVAKAADVAPLPSIGLPEEPALAAIVAEALATDRRARYASAADFADELEAWAARAEFVGSRRALARFLGRHFAEDVRSAQRRRELATRALARGPLAILEILDVPVVGMVPPEAAEPEPESPFVAWSAAKSSAPPSRSPERRWPRSAAVLFAVMAALVGYLVLQAATGH